MNQIQGHEVPRAVEIVRDPTANAACYHWFGSNLSFLIFDVFGTID